MSSTYDLMVAYLEGGGKVLSLAGVPDRLDGNRSHSMVETFGKFADQWISADTIDQHIINDYLSQRDFKPENPTGWGGNVFHMRRILKDGQLYFFTNYDKTETANISFLGKGKSVTEFDLMTGEYHLLDVTPEEGMVHLNFSLMPSGSRLLFISGKSGSGDMNAVEDMSNEKPIQTSSTAIKRLSPNTFTIDYCDVTVANKSFKDIYFFNAAGQAFKGFGRIGQIVELFPPDGVKRLNGHMGKSLVRHPGKGHGLGIQYLPFFCKLIPDDGRGIGPEHRDIREFFFNTGVYVFKGYLGFGNT